MSTAPVSTVLTSEIPGPIGVRLDDQISYHNRKSSKYQKYYKRIKTVEIISAALIPFLSALHVAENHDYVRYALAIGTALLGVLITILEGVLQLYQFQQIWVTSRATAEGMMHEK